MLSNYVYVKKVPGEKKNGKLQRAARSFRILETHRKFGLVLILLGVFFIGTSLSTQFGFFAPSSADIINPEPLSSLAQSIQQQNAIIDNKVPLSNYVPVQTTYDESY